MKKFCVLGNPILHSKSPELFNYIFEKKGIEAVYTRLFAKNIQQGFRVFREMDFDGMNITSPFKKDIISFLDEISPTAKFLNSVNLVLKKNDKFYGYNTDYLGVLNSFKEKNINEKNKNCLIIGSGGAARSAVFALKNANLKIINRTESKAKKIAEKFKIKLGRFENLEEEIRNSEIIVSCVKLGVNLIEKEWLNKDQIVFDANYSGSNLEKICSEKGIEFLSGKDWLVNQAIPSYNYFMNEEIDSDLFYESLNEDSKKDKNKISFIGFMGSGKSSLARKISKKENINLIDLDSEIENFTKKTIPQIFKDKGEDYFRALETKILKNNLQKTNSILDCGGGIILKNKNRNLLKNHMNIFLYSSLKDSFRRIKDSNRPLASSKNFEDLFKKRIFHYLKTSNIIFPNFGSLDETFELLSKEIFE